jgi:hypothetical protein
MLYEYAITPQVFDAATLESDVLQVILLQLFKELAHDGLISALGKDKWRDVVWEKLGYLTPSTRDKVQSALKLLLDRHRFVRHPKAAGTPPELELDWVGLAINDHAQRPLHAIIVSPSMLIPANKEDPPVIPLRNALDMEERATSAHIRECKEDFERVLAPVLRYARKVWLIDPHLNCTKKGYKSTLQLCIQLMRQFPDGLPKYIECHTTLLPERAISAAALLEEWERFLKPHITSRDSSIKLQFEVFIWSHDQSNQRLHDRFIITNQCAISAPGGLECQTKLSFTDWSLLSQEGRDQHIREYDPPSSPFKLLVRREIPPSV